MSVMGHSDYYNETLSPADIKMFHSAIQHGDWELAYRMMWREIPCDMNTFMTGNEFMGYGCTTYPMILKILNAIDHPRVRHAHLNLGKGAGKTFLIARGMLARGIQLLLCYRDPHAIFNMARGTELLSINFSTGKIQAQEAIFAELCSGVRNSSWFEGKYYIKSNEIEFPNNIKVICGHSAGKTFEGLALWRAALDESNLHKDRLGKSNAEDLFDVAREGGFSRFPDAYKVFTISRSVSDTDFESRMQKEIAEHGQELPVSFLDTLDFDKGIPA